MQKMTPLTWQKPLPRVLVIPNAMTLTTLADVRDLIEQHLPPEARTEPAWRRVAAQLQDAAAGGDVIEVFATLRIVLTLEGAESARGQGIREIYSELDQQTDFFERVIICE
jgi:hypothetical protein